MATVTRYFCIHLTSVLLSRYVGSYTLFFCKNVVFQPRLNILIFLQKIFLYYSLNIKGYGISVSEFIGVSITSV